MRQNAGSTPAGSEADSRGTAASRGAPVRGPAAGRQRSPAEEASEGHVAAAHDHEHGAVHAHHDQPPLRPILGDSVPATLFRMTRVMALAGVFGDGLPIVLYSAGRRIGSSLGVATPADLLQAIRDLRMGIPEVIELTDERIVVDVDECLTCSGMPNIGVPLCYFEAGLVSGAVSQMVGRDATVRETRCPAMGDPKCRLEITFNGTEQFLSPHGDMTALTMEDMAHPVRDTLGETAPLALYQTVRVRALSALFEDAAPAVAYLTGFQAGRALDVESLDAMLVTLRQLGLGVPTLVAHDDAHVVIDLRECAACSGLPQTREPVCHMEAGLLAGALSRALRHRIQVRETRCTAVGAPACRFEARFETGE